MGWEILEQETTRKVQRNLRKATTFRKDLIEGKYNEQKAHNKPNFKNYDKSLEETGSES
jgi:hypothetical protein